MNLEEKIGKYMRRDVVYMRPDSRLREVASVMAKSGTDVAVVRSKKDEIMGMITAAELFDALRSYVLGKDVLENIPADLRDIKVEELMRGKKAMDFMDVCGLTGTQVCISLGEDDTIVNVIRVMAIAGISHLLIIGVEGVAGTLCAEDLIKAFTA